MLHLEDNLMYYYHILGLCDLYFIDVILSYISYCLIPKCHYTPAILSMPKGYIVFVHSISPFVCPFVRLGVIPSANHFYNQVLLRSFSITYNSAASDKKLFIFGMGVPGRVLFHSYIYGPLGHAPGRG